MAWAYPKLIISTHSAYLNNSSPSLTISICFFFNMEEVPNIFLKRLLGDAHGRSPLIRPGKTRVSHGWNGQTSCVTATRQRWGLWGKRQIRRGWMNCFSSRSYSHKFGTSYIEERLTRMNGKQKILPNTLRTRKNIFLGRRWNNNLGDRQRREREMPMLRKDSD